WDVLDRDRDRRLQSREELPVMTGDPPLLQPVAQRDCAGIRAWPFAAVPERHRDRLHRRGPERAAGHLDVYPGCDVARGIGGVVFLGHVTHICVGAAIPRSASPLRRVSRVAVTSASRVWRTLSSACRTGQAW